ncbi:2-amino-4-hydroxy-6-hydroxymethyldihydropteridine diphosphokinase [Scardovia wiggsiae]|uniref:2-amino-4-hydroxy-6- hydroxymethyldihydropteridine diphosphokinase n=1 Tax=Scardovia wiggsiae TaxID=230143 RepID=UPI00374ECB3D
MDRITLTGIHAYGTHGLYGTGSSPQARQLFSVDVIMYLDLFDAARSDELVDTVNYDQIASRVISVVGGDHVDLLERLAQKIADAVLLSYRVQKVAVTVHKTAAGSSGALFDDVSVSIERQSQDYNVQAELSAETAESAGKGNAGSAASGAFTAYGDGNRMPPDSRSVGDAGVPGAPQSPAVHHAVIAMGANLGNCEQALRSAVVSIDAIPGNQVTGISPLYRTAPWGMPDGTPDFFNAVVQVDTTHSAEELLDSLHMIESAHGRSREVHWGSRPLDLDIIDFDSIVSESPHLTLPHPRAWQRAFVLSPWRDIEPDAVLRGKHGGPVGELILQAPDRDAVNKVSDDWILGGLA